jgi:hypothetical protein
MFSSSLEVNMVGMMNFHFILEQMVRLAQKMATSHKPATMRTDFTSVVMSHLPSCKGVASFSSGLWMDGHLQSRASLTGSAIIRNPCVQMSTKAFVMLSQIQTMLISMKLASV